MVIMKNKKVKKPFKTRKFQYKPEVEENDDANEDVERQDIPKEVRIIAQEVQIVRSLACNDLNKRNRQIRKLRKWLQLRARSSFPFTEEDFLRIWKGLYYNMWMSDKPLVQEDLAEQLGKLIECFEGDVATSVNFFGAFMKTMCNEWFGIDQWRLDKFMMLVRRMLRYMFRVLRGDGWTKDSITLFNEHMNLTVLAAVSPAIGLTMHYLDIFFEELAKVADGKINEEQVGYFVVPFVTYLAKGRNAKLVAHCRSQVLQHLLFQSSLGREYTDKFNAWKEMGFPTESINDLELVENEADGEAEDGDEDAGAESQSKETHLDPRAGNVDVFMPELPLNAKYVIDELERLLYKDGDVSTKIRKSLRKQLKNFQTYQEGKFPLGVKYMPRFKAENEKPLMKDKIEKLENVENELFGVGRKLKQLNKRKRRKLLKSLNFTEVDESNYDQTILKALPKQYLKERKRKSDAFMSNWVEEELGTEDLLPNKKQKKKKNTESKSNGFTELEAEESSNIDNSKDEEQSLVETNVAAQNDKIEKETKQKTPKRKEVDAAQPTNLEKNAEKVATKTKKQKEVPTKDTNSEWDTPLAEGEIEYFIPSRKAQLKNANANLVPNPLAKKSQSNASTPVNAKKATSAANNATPTGSIKRVKIALKHNTAQNPSEYIKQIKSSPKLPYDADKKPGKGLLKPNSMPSPINPFYKKKIGLRLANDTI
ncbi:ribosomal RNA processing protein 1 homolog [Zeugodacus cucurbitae]|uniref:Ribosomal RNA processing protein 1 homolog n=1 Tax=Zeugodacus cucurbitae TaxID=28588 RepID=A0A0A1XTA4_ZEUCU|nr:ribosomal RNA processing protein 1 homolog [Zeugodacus cucurbitae]